MAKVRTFVAIKLPEELTDRLQSLCQELKSGPGGEAGRWVQPKNIHLTLKFLGDVPEQRLPSIYGAVSNACNAVAPFCIRIAGLGCFPNPRRPRVVWVGVDERTGALAGLHQRIDEAMQALGFEAEKRGFSPHLTLARVSRQATRAQAEILGAESTHRRLGTVGEIEAKAVHVIKSELRPEGARYTDLFEAPLQGDIDQDGA